MTIENLLSLYIANSSQPEPSQPGQSQPGTSQPEPSQPGPSQPGQSQPGTSQPEPSLSETRPLDFLLIRMSSLMDAVGAFSCRGLPPTVCDDLSCRRGLVSKISICCTVWQDIFDYCPLPSKGIEVNNRAHLAMRTLGKGRASMATASNMMGMHPPITSKHCGNHNKRLKVATEAEGRPTCLLLFPSFGRMLLLTL